MAADAGFVASTITSVLENEGYLGLLGLMAIESACIPLPSEIILPFAGFLVFKGEMNLWLVATIGALGCNLGSVPAYWLGRWGGRVAIMRWGRYVMLSPHDVDLAHRFFEHFGSIAVLIARMLPVVRTFIALPAGIAEMPQLRFHIYTFLGSWPWCLLLAYIGYTLDEHWADSPLIASVFHWLDYAIIGLAVLVVARFVWARRRERQREASRDVS